MTVVNVSVPFESKRVVYESLCWSYIIIGPLAATERFVSLMERSVRGADLCVFLTAMIITEKTWMVNAFMSRISKFSVVEVDLSLSS
jgi:hypothetical protein